MQILAILVIALSSNLDNLGVGLAYGARRTYLPLVSNLLIAAITSCGTLVSMVFGRNVAVLASNQQLASDIGAGIIVAMGVYFLIQSLRKNRKALSGSRAERRTSRGILFWLCWVGRLSRRPTPVDKNSIDLSEASILGLALTLNNLPNGFAAGLLGLSPALTTTAVFVLSMLILWLGIWAGSRFVAQFLGSKSALVAGIMLVVLGLYELFQ